jgi:hypothetical protein
MTWIKTLPPTPENPEVAQAMEDARANYPREYAPPGRERLPDLVKNDSIVGSHSLIPAALRHAFATFGALMDPKLPLTRRQHEMIAATVSAANRCFY